MSDLSFKEFQEFIRRKYYSHDNERGTDGTFMWFMEEVGELARIMARKYGDQSFKAGEPTDPSDEMADVLWVLLCLANQTGVDLTEAFKKNLEKKTKRDATRHLNNEKLK